MTRIYNTILTRDDAHSPWGVHNGFWDKIDVVEEIDDLIESCGYKRSQIKVIFTDGSQAQIDELVAHQNGEQS